MKKTLVWFLVACLGCFYAGRALAAPSSVPNNIMSATSKSVIDVRTFYNGDQVLFFGVNPVPGSDIVVKLIPVEQTAITLDVEGRVGPFWMTVKQYRVNGIPSMYKVFATQPLTKIASPETIKDLELGFDAVRPRLKMHLVRGKAAADDPETVWHGLLQLKKQTKLYEVETGPKVMQITESKLFKVQLQFPPAANEGRYQVESYCFQHGQLVGYGKQEVLIKKVGLEYWFTHTSQHRKLFYGILAVLVAVLGGLTVGLIFKKGGHH